MANNQTIIKTNFLRQKYKIHSISVHRKCLTIDIINIILNYLKKATKKTNSKNLLNKKNDD
jgi:hypothetical protein